MVLLGTAGGAVRVTVANPENDPATVRGIIRQDGRAAAVNIALPDGDRARSSVTQTVAF